MGGTGWQEYNLTFRRQAAVDSSLPRNTLLPGLQVATLVGSHGSSWGTICSLCREPNHNANQCTLTVLQQWVRSPFETPRNFDSRYRRSETVLQICASGNRGTCALPHSCTYRHICTVRQRRHTCKGIECLDGHEGSEFTNGSSRWKGFQVRLWFLGIEYSTSHCLMVMCLVCVVIIMDWVEGPLVSVYGLICCHCFIHSIFCSVSG